MHPALIISYTFWSCLSCCTMSEEGEWMGNNIPNIPNFSVLHEKPESLHITCVQRSLTVRWPHRVNGSADFQPELFCPPYRNLIVGRIQWGGREEMQKPHLPLFEYRLWRSCSVFMNFLALGKMLKISFSELVKQQLYHDSLQELGLFWSGLTFVIESKIKHLMLTQNSLCKYLIKFCCWGV